MKAFAGGALAVALMWVAFSLFRAGIHDQQVVRLEHDIDSLSHVEAHRDTVNVTRLVTTRARSDTFLLHTTDTLIHRDTVKVLIAAERAACDTALAGKDSTIAETAATRDRAAALAKRGNSRFALSAVYVTNDRAPVLTLTRRVTHVMGLDVNVGVGYRP